MVKNLVVLVHGMGKFAPGWSTPWQQALAEAARWFGSYRDGRPLGDDLEFVEIRYDGVFDEDVDENGNKKPGYRARWHDLAAALQDQDLPADLQKGLAVLRSNDTGSNAAVQAFWTHLLDPLLWYTLAQARQAVIATVAAQLLQHLQRAVDTGARLHVLAHSLGTSVVHDTLVCLCDPELTQGRLDPYAGGRRWDSLTMVANVSRLLQAQRSPSSVQPVTAFDPLRSRVHTGADGLVARLHNIRHRWDPFTFVRTMADQLQHKGCSWYLLMRFGKAIEIHDLPTQVCRPDVMRALLRTWCGDAALGTDAELRAAEPAYKQRFPNTTEMFRDVASIAEDTTFDVASIATLLQTITRTWHTLQESIA